MQTKVLIANRGAIATRICRTLKKMGITSVAIYSQADADSLHRKVADEAYNLGTGNVKDTYLNQSKIIEIIKSSGAQAVHPGYGFLSENAEFANLCEANNITFLGPTAEQMQMFGLKHTAREIAQQQNVSLLPGSEILNTLEEACNAAKAIGYPVMLKSTAGGGGIGMQLCHNDAEINEAYASVKRLSANNFSNDNVFLEKFIAKARHIEVQFFGDGKGNGITLGARDCSAQRRHQKVIEETPAPNLPADVSQAMQIQAKKLLMAVNYRSAGTVEYIYDAAQQQFYFLEVNTRLQVEHGVTEQVYGVDIVEWMVQLGFNKLDKLTTIEKSLSPKGHAIQVRVYAENAERDFQPSAGLLSHVRFPEVDGKHSRIDHWIESGTEVSPFFDPMLAKVICWAEDRTSAIAALLETLDATNIYGVVTNIDYALAILESDAFNKGHITTRFLNNFSFNAATVEVLSGGTFTTIQDYPGRTGYWDIGVPPSGPFDSVSMQLANKLLENEDGCAVLEITVNGPELKFNRDTYIALCGADFTAYIDEEPMPLWQSQSVYAGQILHIKSIKDTGVRCYLAVKGGWQCPDYLGSKSTFTLGQFGGHIGRTLRTGDVLTLNTQATSPFTPKKIAKQHQPTISHDWKIRVIYGPHGAPDFFTADDIKTFFASEWEVHYNSSRTGIRLIGPKPEWARSDGGEAGMHPSNIHDNAYAFGAIDFTGDMPVILGPDGPSLGGFVCPATVIQADLWKLGQLKVGDKIQFVSADIDNSVLAEKQQLAAIKKVTFDEFNIAPTEPTSAIIQENKQQAIKVVYRPSGDHFLLIEYGKLELDIHYRFRVHALMLWLEANTLPGIQELTPGVRSLQIHYDSQRLRLQDLIMHCQQAETAIDNHKTQSVAGRIVHLPLSWDDEACQRAIEKYQKSVRQDAPWCPSNLEFIRRINGLDSIEAVKKIVFDASYLVIGLGDVYLGAPLAVPLDPSHRLVTTKYNPARTWTAENSVGIGGSYLCIYGMEGPGGYQFVGRTIQMWNRYRKTQAFTQPWLLRFFDQIRFYEVTGSDLQYMREEFPKGNYPIKIEETQFSLSEYDDYLAKNKNRIDNFTEKRQSAFAQELQRWVETGQINFSSDIAEHVETSERELNENQYTVDSHIAGSVWRVLVKAGDEVTRGDVLLVIESMKMEIEIIAKQTAYVDEVLLNEGDSVSSGQQILIMNQVV